MAWARAQPGEGDDHFAQLALWNQLHGQVCRVLLRRHMAARADHLLDALAGLQLYRHHLDGALALERPHHLDAATLRGALAEAFPRALPEADRPAARLPRRDRFRNAVFAGKLGWLLDSRPIETARGGGHRRRRTRVTALKLGDHDSVFGAAGRYLCDMSTPGGWYCMPGGASERRLGIGYGAGLDDWARGRFRPLGGATGVAPSVR